MQEQIDRDLKTAMLAGDKQKTETLRGIKNALQNEAIKTQAPNRVLDEAAIQKVLARESKRRQDTAVVYQNINEQERATAELAEKKVIDQYLPKQLSEEQISQVVQEEIAKLDNPAPADMGRVIGAVKAKLNARADGATIARLVKERLNQ